MTKRKSRRKLEKSIKTRLIWFVGVPLACIFTFFVLISLPIIPDNIIKAESVPYSKQNTQDSTIELGESKTVQTGVNGKKEVTYKVSRSLLNILFGGAAVNGKVVSSVTKQAPLNKIIASGTRKYQYMYCSNGGYRYYTDDQFKNASTGFTHQSKDYCAVNKQGTMTQLADAAPGATTTANVRPYIPPNCSTIDIPYSTTYQNVSYLTSGQTQSSGGFNGYKVTCTAGSTGYIPSGYTIQPINKVVYGGTGTSTVSTNNSATTSAMAREKCTSDYSRAKAQIIMANAGNSSAMEYLNVLYAQCLSRAG